MWTVGRVRDDWFLVASPSNVPLSAVLSILWPSAIMLGVLMMVHLVLKVGQKEYQEVLPMTLDECQLSRGRVNVAGR